MYIGNMGNPVITRLGINQFWYKHWYSDTTTSLNIKQDDSFEQLINVYLNYGLSFNTNPFIHEYWYRKSAQKVRVSEHVKNNMRFFRRFFYTNDNLSIEHTYLIRNQSGEYFPMRTWVLKYGGWIIILIHWFKPIKTKRVQSRNSGLSSFVGAVSKPTIRTSAIKRLKLVTLNLLLAGKKNFNTYHF